MWNNRTITYTYNIGDPVLMNIEEHPWYKRPATICDIGHTTVRVDFEGTKIWVPNDWITPHDFN
jgi:hypothetical protein